MPDCVVYDSLYKSLYGYKKEQIQQTTLSQKVQMLQKFLAKAQMEYEENMKNGDQDPVNLDVEPPKAPEEELPKGDEKYNYYDKLFVADDYILFRYFKLRYLQKGKQFK